MKLVVALTGTEWPLDVEHVTTLQELKDKVYDLTLIPPQHQILLSDSAHSFSVALMLGKGVPSSSTQHAPNSQSHHPQQQQHNHHAGGTSTARSAGSESAGSLPTNATTISEPGTNRAAISATIPTGIGATNINSGRITQNALHDDGFDTAGFETVGSSILMIPTNSQGGSSPDSKRLAAEKIDGNNNNNNNNNNNVGSGADRGTPTNVGTYGASTGAGSSGRLADSNSSFINLFDQNAVIFLYNKRELRMEDGIFTIGDPDIDPPVPKSVLISKSIGYNEAFQSHSTYVHHVARSCTTHIEFMKRTLEEVQNQIKGIQTAYTNLTIYMDNLRSRWFNLKTLCDPDIVDYKSILNSFNKDVELLSKIRVSHEAMAFCDDDDDDNENDRGNNEQSHSQKSTQELQTVAIDPITGEKNEPSSSVENSAEVNDTRPSRTLEEFIPLSELRKWRQQCESLFSDFQRKLEYVDKDVANISHIIVGIDEIVSTVKLTSDVKVNNEGVQSLQTRIKNDYSKVSGILERSNQRQDNSSGFAGFGGSHGPSKLTGDEKEALEHLLEIHLQDYIPNLEALDSQIRDKAMEVWSEKVRITNDIHDRLIQICHLESRIAMAVKVIVSLGTLRIVLSEAFKQLIHLQTLPFAYAKCIRETFRRKYFLESTAFEIWKFNQRLIKLRDEELRVERDFNNQIGSLLPRKVFDLYKPDVSGDPRVDQVTLQSERKWKYSFGDDYSELVDINPRFMADIEYGNSVLPRIPRRELDLLDELLENTDGAGGVLDISAGGESYYGPSASMKT